MSDTTTERNQSGVPNLPGSGTANSTPFTSPKRNDFASALFEASKPKNSEKPAPTGERGTTASTSPTPEGESESEGSSVAPQQSSEATKPEEGGVPENLTPEERWRREAQSEKDKRYQLEAERAKEKAEREVYEEHQRIAQMDRVEANSYQQFQSQVKPLESRAWDLHNRAEAARQDGDIELANYFEAAKVDMVNAVQAQYGQFNQWAQMNRQQVFAQKQTAQERQLSRTLEKSGITLDELRTANPKLNTSNPFEVIEAVSKVAATKQEAKYKSDVEKAKQDAKDAKNKWRTDSPASVPDRHVSSGTAKPGNHGRGNASTDLAEGLFGKRK